MSQSPFPGPISPENNPPIHPEYYQPRVYDIEDLVYGVNTLVTTTVDHDYVIGQLIRLVIPFTYGAQQLNEQQGYIIQIPSSNQVLVNINSTQANFFNPSPAYGPTPPQILAIGDINTGPINTGRRNNQTYIQGSFINISPN